MKVLIIAYDFPPLASAGALRPYSWFKYFPDAGVYPVVITKNWSENNTNSETKFIQTNDKIDKVETPDGLVIRLPQQSSLKQKIILKNGMNKKVLLRKSITLLEEFLKYFVSSFDDKNFLYEYADDFLRDNKVDCILVTGEPFILFKHAHRLSKKYGIPWFADYRDGWTNNHSRKQGLISNLLTRYAEFFEKHFTSNARGFSSVSPQLVSAIKNIISKDGVVIPNGVDLDLVNSIEVEQDTDIFTIVYTGVFYSELRVREFLEAYEKFLTKGERKNILTKFIGIDFYPNENVSRVKDFAARFPENMVVLSRLSHEESIAEQKKASVLLNFILGAQSDGLIGAKTYEYFAIRKPFIVVPLHEEKNPPLFPNRKAQFFANNVEEIQNLLENFYERFQTGEELTTDITDAELYSISRKKQALTLAEYIKSKVSRN